jgi:O-acetyl-ADP-ribose deacetylase (regulator of RNase III)
MSYREIQGDLFDTDAPVIVHGCNCQGVMGAGVAKIVKDKWPHVYKKYVELVSKKSAMGLLGTYQVVPTDKQFIVNAFTQLKPGSGKQVSYDAIDQITKDLNGKFYQAGIHRVAMPMIGAGLAGGNWNIIRTIIQENLVDVGVEVYYL